MRGISIVAFLIAGRALAAPLPDDARLDGARTELQSLIDDAARKGLPDALLADKVREGLAKNVPAPRIAQAVRALASALESARAEAQPHVAGAPPPALLKAIADAHALGAGAAVPAVLAATERSRAQTRAVEVLADLALRGYPPQAAARTIAEVARRPAELDKLAARAESLTARGATRVEALDALYRSSGAGLGLDGASQLVHGDVGDGRGPNRETAGPRGPGADNGHGHGHGKP